MTDIEPLPQSGGQQRSSRRSVAEILGTVCRVSELPENLASNPGLIQMTTSDGLDIAPIKQFVISENGERELIPEVAEAWVALRSIHAQRGMSTFSTLLAFMGPRRNSQEQTLFDVVSDPTVLPAEKAGYLYRILDDNLYSAAFEGSEIIDPRRLL